MRLGWTKGKHVLTSVPTAHSSKKKFSKKTKIYNIQHGHQQQRQDILTWFSFCYIELWSFKLAEFIPSKGGFFRPWFYLQMNDVLDEIFFKNLYAHIWIWFKVHLVSDIPRKNTVKFDKQAHVNHSKLNTLTRILLISMLLGTNISRAS